MKFFTIVILFLILVSSLILRNHLHNREGFCMACHMSNNRFMHEEKYMDFFLTEPVNLSGIHRIKTDNGRGKCIDCHRGIGIMGEINYIITNELSDLGKYLFKPAEPLSLSIKMPDMNCIYCHKNISGYKKFNGFHSYNAHKGEIPVRCVKCHISHDNNVDRRYFSMNKEKVLNICFQCHRGLSKRVRETLKVSSKE